MAQYKIELSGRGADRGIGKITEAQYNYWADEDKEDDLPEALTGNYDYDENETPEECRLLEYYEYEDVGFWSGPEDDCCWITLTDENGNEIVNEELAAFADELHGDDEDFEFFQETSEFYMNYDLESGYYVYWAQGGKGTYFEGYVDVDTFDQKLLNVETIDFEGDSIILKVMYDGEEVENVGGNWWGKWSDFSLHKVEK